MNEKQYTLNTHFLVIENDKSDVVKHKNATITLSDKDGKEVDIQVMSFDIKGDIEKIMHDVVYNAASTLSMAESSETYGDQSIKELIKKTFNKFKTEFGD